MECGKLTAKLRDAVPVIFIEEGREPKRFKNIEIPDEVKSIEYKDFKFDVPASGQITFKIYFEHGSLPEEWPEARSRKHRTKAMMVEQGRGTTTADDVNGEDALEAAIARGDTVGDVEEPPIVATNYNVTGDRRKELVAAIADLINEKPQYMALPTYAFQIGPYEVSKTGTLTGPASETLTAWLHDKGFDAE